MFSRFIFQYWYCTWVRVAQLGEHGVRNFVFGAGLAFSDRKSSHFNRLQRQQAIVMIRDLPRIDLKKNGGIESFMLVDEMGVEPTASAVRVRRSPN